MLRNTSCGHDGECCQKITGLQSWKGLWGFPTSVSLLCKQENTHPDWWNLWLLAAKPKLVILSPTQATLEPAPMVRIQNSKESFQSIEQLTEVLNIREPAFLGSHRAPGHSWRASPLIHARIISISLIFFSVGVSDSLWDPTRSYSDRIQKAHTSGATKQGWNCR